MVYARKVDGRKLTFQVSGMLWNRSLVMRDVETGSLWSHLLGKCMRGKLEGKELEVLPAVMTTWKEWKEEHRETTVLALGRTSRAYDRQFYRDPEKFVLGVVAGGGVKAYGFDVLREKKVIEDKVGSEPVLVVFDPESTKANVFSRREGLVTISFETTDDGELIDRETGSRWDPEKGRAVEGPLEGKRLEALPAIVSFRRAWKVFHPQSEYAR